MNALIGAAADPEPMVRAPGPVIAAREGNFARASALSRKAKSVEPSYPNIDQLIGEAEKRKKD